MLAFVAALSVQGGLCAHVLPEDDGRVLQNPDMGWTMQYYSNVPYNYGSTIPPGDSMAWFPGCSVCYLRIPWAYLEPQEGVYNWSATGRRSVSAGGWPRPSSPARSMSSSRSARPTARRSTSCRCPIRTAVVVIGWAN